MVHNIVALEEQTVCGICTPRSVMSTLDADMTIVAALTAGRENHNQFSRIPIKVTNATGVEDVIGYVTVHDLVAAENTQEHVP